MQQEQIVTLPTLTEETLEDFTSDTIIARGREYYTRGAVLDIQQAGSTITAIVEGSGHTYSVKVEYDDQEITNAHCSCPYDFDCCKHVIAILLCCIHTPEKIQKTDVLLGTLKNSLDTLNAGQLKELIFAIVHDEPKLFNAVVLQIKSICQAAQNVLVSNLSQNSIVVDPNQIKREAYGILHSLDNMRRSQAYWYVGDVIEQLRGIIVQAKEFIALNDAQNALVILKTLTEVYVDEWHYLDGSNGETAEFFGDLDDAWSEALLHADIKEEQAQSLAEDLEAWGCSAGEYGVDDCFEKSLLALEQGWHEPEIKNILFGQYDQPRETYDYAARALAKVRLSILEQQQRYTEYEYLARYEGLTLELMHVLFMQDRVDEAFEYAQDMIDSPKEALQVAREFHEKGHGEQALYIGSLGLALEGTKAYLGSWLGDVAALLGNDSLAQRAYRVAFEDQISLDLYKRILKVTPAHEIATLKKEVLEFLRKTTRLSISAIVDIFLYEDLLDDAIAMVESASYVSADTLETVLGKALSAKPKWVIERAHKMAMQIIDPGKASYYDEAVNWLRFVKKSYESCNDTEGWQMCISTIRSTHKPKRKLMGLLAEAFGNPDA